LCQVQCRQKLSVVHLAGTGLFDFLEHFFEFTLTQHDLRGIEGLKQILAGEDRALLGVSLQALALQVHHVFGDYFLA
jgi:hypothetical protein